jgi:translation initiation factor IF-3
MGEDGESLGFVTIGEALRKAEEFELDLVEVAPDADPPVCKLMDMGKHKYRQKKRLQEQRSLQSTVELKEIWLRPRIDTHDLDVKLNHAKAFLEQGFRVAVTMRFRARELLHKEIGVNVLNEVAEQLKDHGKVESENTKEARRMQIIVVPPKKKKGQV